MTKDAQNWTLLGVVALLIAAGVAWLGWSIAADTDASPGDRAAGPGRGGVDAEATPAARSGPDGTLDLPRTEVAVAGRGDRGSVLVHGRVLDPFGEPLAGALVGDAGSDRPVVAGT